MKKINNAEKVAPVQPLSLIPFLAKSGAKRKVKSWKALLIRTLSTSVFIYMIASATKKLISYSFMYLEIATSNYYFLNRLTSLARTLFLLDC